jgi:hypothetical protein
VGDYIKKGMEQTIYGKEGKGSYVERSGGSDKERSGRGFIEGEEWGIT